MPRVDEERLLQEQIQYYRLRGGEYDEWFFREGRYDRGPVHRDAWFGEVARIEAALDAAIPPGDVLELACGTGLWTRRLAATHRHILAVDASSEVIGINRERVKSDRVDYLVADLYDWTPPAGFDAVFFSFWLSHVPTTRFDAFWTMVRRALKPGGTVFFVDSLVESASTARDHHIDASGVVERRLNDGQTFAIVKIFYEPEMLERELATRGWQGEVRSTGQFFLYGRMTAGEHRRSI